MMKEKINVAELLKDCPEGMELECVMFENVTLSHISESGTFPIKISTPIGKISLSKYGGYTSNELSKCLIFPKNKTTWEGFHRPFKDGDIVATKNGLFIGIIKIESGVEPYAYVSINNMNNLRRDVLYIFERLATEEEKQKLLQAIKDKGFKWNEETKTLEKLSPDFREHSDNEPLDIPTMTTEFVKEHGLPCPNGYVFKDDNGNEILTSKIILEKIKKEYPKTYKECLAILNYNMGRVSGYKASLLAGLQDLLVCRNAYWKIAGEEMGLGKPWEPDYIEESYEQGSPVKYVIYYTGTHITKGQKCTPSYILSFPTAKMRDAFYDNFKEEIEQCKELL